VDVLWIFAAYHFGQNRECISGPIPYREQFLVV
jgi:hypothetical protein